MKTCSRCGRSFDLSSAKRSIGRWYGAGSYDDYYPEEDVCKDCAVEEVGADYATGQDIINLMGTGWDPD